MLVDGAGQIIVDAFTANRSYASIPSASSLLDTSNYTIQAVSFGKDAAGFKFHAHQILQPSSSVIIKVVSYNPVNVSSYQTSTTALALSSIYNLLPASPSPLDTRLEPKNTIPYDPNELVINDSGILPVPNIGHCLNSVIISELSSFSHIIGCYPSSSGTPYWMVSSATNPSGSLITSSVFSSFYNFNSIMDWQGYLTFASGNAATHLNLLGAAGNLENENSNFTQGCLRIVSDNFPRNLLIKIPLFNGDAGSLLLFGGLYQLGLWVLDIKETLKQNITAPFPFNTLNNKRKYKLFAKKTFNKDLLFCRDWGSNSGMRSLFSTTGNLLSDGKIVITWNINFV